MARRRPTRRTTRTTAATGTRSAPSPTPAPATAPASPPVPTPQPAAPAPGASANLPTVQPFLTPEQQQVNIENQSQWEEALHAIDDQLAKMGIDKTYQQTQIERGRVREDSAANDNAAARGIFSSSIRAGNLADIDASAALRSQYLTDQFNIASTQGEERKVRLTNARNAFVNTTNQQAVGNAQAQKPQTSTDEPQAGQPQRIGDYTPEEWQQIFAATSKPPVAKQRPQRQKTT